MRRDLGAAGWRVARREIAKWRVAGLGAAVLVALAGCTNMLVERQAELRSWVGQPETALLGAMGAPSRSYETAGMKYLTYEDRQVEYGAGSPYFIGPGPYWYGGAFPPAIETLVCDTTFTVAGGVVRAFSLRGNACG